MSWVLDDGDDTFEFFGSDFTSSKNDTLPLATLVREMRGPDGSRGR